MPIIAGDSREMGRGSPFIVVMTSGCSNLTWYNNFGSSQGRQVGGWGQEPVDISDQALVFIFMKIFQGYDHKYLF